MAEINQTKFAQLAGVSRNSIKKAIASGKLIRTASKKIDDQHSLSLRYLRIQLQKSKDGLVKEKLNRPKSIKLVKKKATTAKLKRICEPGDAELIDKLSKSAPRLLDPILKQAEKMTKKKAPAPSGRTKNPEPMADDIDDAVDIVYEKDAVDIEYKKVQTEKGKIHNAKELRFLVPTEFIKKKFGKISAAILNYFFPLGERLAPHLCGIVAITDPKIIKKFEIEINKEMTRGLAEIKKIATEEIKE